MADERNHCRCTMCGHIEFDEQDLIKCPKCGLRLCMVDSLPPKMEALSLLCEAFKIGPMSYSGQKIKQALDVIFNVKE